MSTTYFVPTCRTTAPLSQEELDSIVKDSMVKISDGSDRFWVTVDRVAQNTIVGRTENQLCSGQIYRELGSRVQFSKKDVLVVDDIRGQKQIIAFLNLLTNETDGSVLV